MLPLLLTAPATLGLVWLTWEAWRAPVYEPPPSIAPTVEPIERLEIPESYEVLAHRADVEELDYLYFEVPSYGEPI